MHDPPEQSGVLFGVGKHNVPQVPQLCRSVARLASHPFAAFPSQFASPRLQIKLHIPPEQTGLPFGTWGQDTPQTPQLFGSFIRLVSHPFARFPSQFPKPPPHWKLQFPAEQNVMPFGPVGQVCPQPPQLAGSVPVFDSHPLTGLPSQSENPALHCKPQLPAEQVAMLFGPEGHVLVQEPQ